MMFGEAIFGRAVLHFRRQTPQQQSLYPGDTPKISTNIKSNYVIVESNDSLTGEQIHEEILNRPTQVLRLGTTMLDKFKRA